ncbi:hypothetical protein D3C74_474950 [compost metagenome]
MFIPQSALDNPKLKWPKKYIQKEGAEDFSKIDDLIRKLEQSNVIQLIESTTNDSEKAVTSVRQLSLFEDKEV